MAVSCGFYNSLNGDRKYNATQISEIFDGVIEDGVFKNIGDCFAIKENSGTSVIVKSGKAWFNHTWTLNDSDLPVECGESEVVLNRYDMIVIEVDSSNATRNNTIKFVKGTPANTAKKPTPVHTDSLNQYVIGYIYREAGSTSIKQSDIEYNVGKSDCPYVIAATQSVDIDQLFLQWDAQFNRWFDNLKVQLSGDVAANLQRQIDAIITDISGMTFLQIPISQNEYGDFVGEVLIGLPDDNKQYCPVGWYVSLGLQRSGTGSKSYTSYMTVSELESRYPTTNPIVGIYPKLEEDETVGYTASVSVSRTISDPQYYIFDVRVAVLVCEAE